MYNIPDFLRVPSEMQEHFAKGGLIKRADGSYSRRGLWDNIRANRGSGRKPTKEMLEQEAKIRAEKEYGGLVDEYGNGGYTVKRSHERKGKTHVVIGPDGTKKYFGDSKLGQHPNDPARKKAFYARHKHNLANNPYFRAFARATWAEGGEVPEFEPGGYYKMPQARIEPSDIHLNLPNTTHNQMSPLGLNTFLVNDRNQGIVIGGVNPRFQTEEFSVGPYARMVGNRQFQAPMYGVAGTYHVNDNVDVNGEIGSNGFGAGVNYHFKRGGNYGPFYNRRDAAKLQRWRTPMASSMTPHFADGGRTLPRYQIDGLVTTTANTGQGINSTWSSSINPMVTTPNINTAGLSNQNQNQFTMDQKQVTTTTPSDDTKMQSGVDVTNKLVQSVPAPLQQFDTFGMVGKGIEQLKNAGEQALGATSIFSRTFANSQQNAMNDYLKAQNNPSKYLNKVDNSFGVAYAKNGGTIAQYKEGEEIELTPTQMYLLEKKGYKFQILNK